MIFLVLAFLFGLSACTDRESAISEAEMTSLKKMVDTVSVELNHMGFANDLSDITIDVRHASDLSALFNQIRESSQRNAPSFGPAAVTESSEERLAFYDPNTKTIVFSHNAPKRLTKSYLAHELAHVYQDQTIGLSRIWQDYQNHPSQEAFNIAHYLVEGHAELVREAYEQKYAKNRRKVSSLSAHLGDIFANDCIVCDESQSKSNLPYSLGMRFLVKQYLFGGWGSVESVLTDLPSSTEQIIHPEKYKVDEPLVLDLSPFDESGWQLIFSGALGEAFLLDKLINLASREDAIESASGWDGDIAQLYKTAEGKEALVWRIVFDRPIDAQQMEKALRKTVAKGEILRDGRMIDWIIVDDQETRKRLRSYLLTNDISLPTNLADENSTIQQEESIKDDAEDARSPLFI